MGENKLMTMMKTRIIIGVLFLLTNVSTGFACDCKPQKTVKAEVESSKVVFVGTILNKRRVVIGDTSSSYTTVAGYDLLVHLIYKGKITKDTITIFTGLGSADCGVHFEIGKKYVVYGRNEDHSYDNFKYPKAQNTFWTNNCMRTAIYNEAEINQIELYTRKLSRRL